MPTIQDILPKRLDYVVGCFLLMAACVILAIYVQFEEYRFRKSFRATFTRFHVWCLTMLACLFVAALLDIYVYVVYARYPNDLNPVDIGIVYILNSLAVNGLLATYTTYIYNRSSSVVWGGAAGIWAKRFVYVNLFLYGFVLIPVFVGVFSGVDTALEALLKPFTTGIYLLSAFILVCLDIFYTRVFVAQVRTSNSLFRSTTNDKDIIANYGLLCVAGSISSLICYFVYSALNLLGSPSTSKAMLAVRWFTFLTALGMVLMKQQLNKAQVSRSQANSTQKSGLKASVASKDVKQSSSMSDNTHGESFVGSESAPSQFTGNTTSVLSDSEATESIVSTPASGDNMV